MALEAIPFSALLADQAGNVVAVNRRWVELTGLSEEQSTGLGWLDALDADSRNRVRVDVVAATTGSIPPASDHVLLARDGRRWSRWWLSSHLEQQPGMVVIAVADVHDERAREADLYHMATHDPLTGLLNRKHFLESLDQALRRKARQSTRVGVIFMDLDGFKRVNDLRGHAVGDRVLLAVAARLRHMVRTGDLVARIGGDEFAVLCHDLIDEEHAASVVGRLETFLADTVDLDGESWEIAASVGSAVDEGPADTPEALLDRADQAMYAAKAARRSAWAPRSADTRAPLPVYGSLNGDPPRTAAASPGSGATGASDPPPAPRSDPQNGRDLLCGLKALRDSIDAVRARLESLPATDSLIDLRDGLNKA